VLAGAGGLRLLKQDAGTKFVDVTAQTKLPASVLNAHYEGTWGADIDSDGDLDIVVSSENQPPTVLRNNGDGTFVEIHPFAGVVGLRDFVWADIDGDGDPDAALVDNVDSNKVGHHLHIFSNERSGQFQQRPLPSELTTVEAIGTADINQDSVLDIIALQDNGSIVAISDVDEVRWNVSQIASLDNAAQYVNRDIHLAVVDLDNNGANDLVLTFGKSNNSNDSDGAVAWLGDKDGKLRLLPNQSILGTDVDLWSR
jgi:hypothetical protein